MAVATPCWPAPVSAMMRALAHPLGEQRLAERVVDLVRAGVEQVLALQVDVAPDALGEPLGVVERRRPPDVVAQQPVEPLAKRGSRARLEPRLLELGERGHQRLGHVAAAVGAEALLEPPSCRGHQAAARRAALDRVEERLQLRRGP